MIKVYLLTGTYELQRVDLDCNINDDIFAALDEHVQEHKEDFRVYDYNELLDNFQPETIDEEFLPINGGEYHIDAISHIENDESLSAR